MPLWPIFSLEFVKDIESSSPIILAVKSVSVVAPSSILNPLIKEISKSFDGVEILKEISTVFDKGKTNLIIGQSGSGKTVLMKCLLGLLEVERGNIYFDNEQFDKDILNEPISVVVSCQDRSDMLNISVRSWLLHEQIKEIVITMKN